MKIKTGQLFILLSTLALIVSVSLGLLYKDQFVVGPFVMTSIVTYFIIASILFMLTGLLHRSLEKTNQTIRPSLTILVTVLICLGLIFSYNIWEHTIMTMYLKEKTDDAIFAYEKVMTIVDIFGLLLLSSGLITLLFKFLKRTGQQTSTNSKA